MNYTYNSILILNCVEAVFQTVFKFFGHFWGFTKFCKDFFIGMIKDFKKT